MVENPDDHNLARHFKKALLALTEPHPSVSDERNVRRTRISLALQIAFIALWITHDILFLLGYDTPTPKGLWVVYLVSFIIGKAGHYQISTIITILTLNIIPFIVILSFQELTTLEVFSVFAWVSWTILVASYILDLKSFIVVFLVNELALVIAPFFFENLSIDMMPFSMAFMLCISISAILGTRVREAYSEVIIRQRELELYFSLLRHDLKNDLSTILGVADVLAMEVEDPAIMESINLLTEVGTRMHHVVDMLSQFPFEEYSSFVSMIEKISEETKLAHKALTITVQVDEDVRSVGLEGRQLFILVFQNLLLNAIVHGAEDSCVEVNFSRLSNYIEVTVSDNGPGIEPKIRDTLFQRGTSTREGGGLGLYLSRRIVESMGGTLELLESKPGEGASFRILLPTRQ